MGKETIVNILQPAACGWANSNEVMRAYHDNEWGVPKHDETVLFEYLTLETFQAGLSWNTVLQKREAFREAFYGFEVDRVARMTEEEQGALLGNAGIIRNRLKIAAAVNNARVILAIKEKGVGLDAYLWEFVGGAPIVNQWQSMSELPATTPMSDTMSKKMKKDGFKFMGSTVCYAHAQATGMVNDHLIACPCHPLFAGK